MKILKRANSEEYRTIYNPDDSMRLAQYLLLTKVLNTLEIPDYIYAFEPGKSIPVMANKHVNKKMVISVDLKDFFSSIKQKNLVELFKSLGASAQVAVTIAELCTYKFFVPQGAITSPRISNLVSAASFGPELKAFCDSNGYVLTIYADDITISFDEEDVNISELLKTIRGIISKYSFRMNYKKTKVMPSTSRQWVCGVVTNVKTNMLKRDRLRLKAIVHNISINGVEKEAKKMDLEPDKFLSVIQGKLNWFRQLNPAVGGRLFDKFKEVVKP